MSQSSDVLGPIITTNFQTHVKLTLEKMDFRTALVTVALDIKTTKQMTRGLLQSFGRRRNKIATFAVMYHVHVNSFPVCGTASKHIKYSALFLYNDKVLCRVYYSLD